jgi:2-polyprenyl-3-methyl-5-hydroxy-6-metoxy-1,4-benzoquinol methylase
VSIQEEKMAWDFPKMGYLAASLKKLLSFQPKSCPTCWSGTTSHVKTKYLVTSLRLCTSCHLMFRYPKDAISATRTYFQWSYQEKHVTELPREEELPSRLESNFSHTNRDFTPYLAVLPALKGKPGMKVLDFGCSWGYGAYQLRQAGYDAIGFEISEPRAEYGKRNLGLTIISDRTEAATIFVRAFDLILACHVLEHLPSLNGVFEWLDALMKPGALFIAFCPNGNLERAKVGAKMHKLWGQKHPLLLDAAFLQKRFSQLGWTSRFASSPYDLTRISRWPEDDPDPLPALLGDELLAVAWKPPFPSQRS